MEQNYNIYCYDKGNRDVILYDIQDVPEYLLKKIVDLLKRIFVSCEIVAEIVMKKYVGGGVR